MAQHTPSRGIELAHSAIAATASVLVVGFIVWGVNACSARDDALKRTCIEAAQPSRL